MLLFTTNQQTAKGAANIKHAANFITASRFVFAGLLLLAHPFSALFWAWYLCGGVSDLLDGPVASKLHQQSETGAKLDSAADFLFILCVGIAVVRSAVFPAWVLISAGVIALVRFAAYGVGYFKYRTFSALHTVLNKAAGALLFTFPRPVQFAGYECGVCNRLRRRLCFGCGGTNPHDPLHRTRPQLEESLGGAQEQHRGRQDERCRTGR